jgi:hypothetical protein
MAATKFDLRSRTCHLKYVSRARAHSIGEKSGSVAGMKFFTAQSDAKAHAAKKRLTAQCIMYECQMGELSFLIG